MDPERTKLTAPERIYLDYTSFWYETSEEGLHDIEYVRADLLATAGDDDKAKARELIGNVNNYAQEDGELSITAFGPLSQRVAAALATVRAEEREAATEDYAYAVRLATVLRDHFYPDSRDWQPLETLNGVLSQIDNMIAGLLKRSEKPRSFRIQEATGPF